MNLLRSELVDIDTRYLSVSDAAKRLHVSENTIRRMADSGSIPCIKTISGFRVFTESDINRLRDERRRMYEADAE